MKDQISALIDEEVDLESSQHLFTALGSDSGLKECWHSYHLIGDVLRGSRCMSPGFHERLMQQLEQEPTVVAPHARRSRLAKPSFMLSAGSAVAAVAFVGWMVWGQQHLQVPQPAQSAAIAQNSVSPEAVNSYLLAHQEFSPSGDIQTASYVQPAAYSESGR